MREFITRICCNSILAKIEANNAGADDALMLDTRGFRRRNERDAHFHRAREGEPARRAECVACPEGITRATVIEICAAERIRCVGNRSVTRRRLRAPMKYFAPGRWANSRESSKSDDRLIGDGKVGLITRRLSELYVQRTATRRHPSWSVI